MFKRKKTITAICFVSFLASLVLFSPMLYAGNMHGNFNKLKELTDTYIKTYAGGTDGGLAHITYWGLPAADPDYYNALAPEEQGKVGKINANVIHAAAFQPTNSD
ncbi:MAG: hypothetical protein WBB19_05520, partial [Desulforhopalus sp.]